MSWKFFNGKLIAPDGRSWSARSGDWGKGHLPNGDYRIGSTTAIASASNASFRDPCNFAWWCPLTPMFPTGRTSLGIHPDGGVPGTEGCIGISDDDTRSAYDALRNSKGDTLSVK